MKDKRIKLFIIIIGVLAAGICYSLNRGTERISDPVPALTEASAEQEQLLTESGEAGDFESETPAVCYVHICGEVVSPGVYELEEGSRVFQAVEKAGGLTEQAAAEALNMAQPVTDGMKLLVPAQGDEPLDPVQTGDFPSVTDTRVNLNTATKEQLMELKGIGASRADDIIRYREQHGSFRVIEDIMNVSGIKNAAFEKIKDKITV